MDSSNFSLGDLGGGLTILSLLGVLVQNFLTYKKDDSSLKEKVNQLNHELEKIHRQQGELLLVCTNNVNKVELLLQSLHGENQLLHQQLKAKC